MMMILKYTNILNDNDFKTYRYFKIIRNDSCEMCDSMFTKCKKFWIIRYTTFFSNSLCFLLLFTLYTLFCVASSYHADDSQRKLLLVTIQSKWNLKNTHGNKILCYLTTQFHLVKWISTVIRVDRSMHPASTIWVGIINVFIASVKNHFEEYACWLITI